MIEQRFTLRQVGERLGRYQTATGSDERHACLQKVFRPRMIASDKQAHSDAGVVIRRESMVRIVRRDRVVAAVGCHERRERLEGGLHLIQRQVRADVD